MSVVEQENEQDYRVCKELIQQEKTVDFIVRYRDAVALRERFRDICVQPVSENWAIIYAPVELVPQLDYGELEYYPVPKLYGIMDISSVNESGILAVQNPNGLNLTGQGVIFGIIDTGIDYQHRAFQDEFGNTRIIAIWDQTEMLGEPPQGFLYGCEYVKEEINRALRSENPLDIVREQDIPNGHGTFMAGIAAGSDFTGSLEGNRSEMFVGVAHDADLVVVKLRTAGRKLRDYYQIPEGAIAYSESDIMTAIRYLKLQAAIWRKPLVICMGLGTSYGPHTSGSPLGQLLNQVSEEPGVVTVVPMGNEGNAGRHFLGNIGPRIGKQEVELRVGGNNRGFLLELWGTAPDIFSIDITTPGGERVERIQPGVKVSRRVEFIYDETIIEVTYRLVETVAGRQVIVLRFLNPSQGIWKIGVYDVGILSGYYNMWLPIGAFLDEDTYFLNDSPYLTLTQPASTAGPICVGAYNHRNNSLWLDSGRGYAADGIVKPELVAPGVEILGPKNGGAFTGLGVKTGTSVAAAFVAGAATLLLQWRYRMNPEAVVNTSDIKSLLILGAKRDKTRDYPNPEWGYGRLNVQNIFDVLAGRNIE